MNDPQPDATASSGMQSAEFEQRIFGIALRAGAVAAVAALVFAAAVGGSPGAAFEIFGMATILGCAAAACGALLGFLFGIPRTLQSETAPTSDSSTRYLANTNLEQISDWLTKILVGITLVQIGSIGPQLANLATALGPMLGGSAASPGFGLALCVYGVVAAFLITYLWTRLRLKRELQIADQDIEATVRAVVGDQSNADAVAFSMVERQLNGQGTPSPEELATALGKASGFARVQVYQRAEKQRANNWRGPDPDRRTLHERTIPVFRALIAVDPDREYHRNHGSLGFALKDSDPADHGGAIAELTAAIEIRGPATTGGFALYEWNRAVCRILTDPASQMDQPSAPELRAAIEADLRVAAQRLGDGLFNPTPSDPGISAVASWLARNGLTTAALRT